MHRNLAPFPLLAPREGASGYVLLDDALERKLTRVTEVSREGSVPELAFENAPAGKILLVDGDELVGAKQNRILNLSILAGGGRRIVIPVSCVEQGRWAQRSAELAGAKGALFARARAKKMRGVTESLRSSGLRDAGQAEIWSDVAEKLDFCGAASPTCAMSNAYERSAPRLEGYARAFRAERLRRSAVVAIDGRVAGLELIDSAATFTCYLEKLVRSYALDAIESTNGKPLAPAEAEVRRFLEAVKAAAAEKFAALGEGEDIRLSGAGVSGAALAAEGRLVHLEGCVVN